MNCPICRRSLLIERVSIQTLAITEEIVGLSNQGDIEYEASQVVDSLAESGSYFRCSQCLGDLQMSESQVIAMIASDPEYGKQLVA